MSVKAIRIEDSKDLTLRILNEVLSDRRSYIEIKPTETAVRVGVSECVVRYHIKKLVETGYLRPVGKGYEPTENVLFLKTK